MNNPETYAELLVRIATLQTENDSLTHALKLNRNWLQSALDCTSFKWDPDQHAAASECVHIADIALAAAQTKTQGK